MPRPLLLPEMPSMEKAMPHTVQDTSVFLAGEQYKQKHPYFQPEHVQKHPLKTLLEASQRKHEYNGGFSPEPAARCLHTAHTASQGSQSHPAALPAIQSRFWGRCWTAGPGASARKQQHSCGARGARGGTPRSQGLRVPGGTPRSQGLPVPGGTPRSQGLLPPGRGSAGPRQAGPTGAPGAAAAPARPCGSVAPRPGRAGRALPPLSPGPAAALCPYSHPRLRRAAQGRGGPGRGTARRGAGTRRLGRGRAEAR